MAEKHRHSFDGHTGEENLNGECVAETVSVTVWNKRDLKESLKPSSPIRNGALNLTDARNRQEQVDGSARLRSVSGLTQRFSDYPHNVRGAGRKRSFERRRLRCPSKERKSPGSARRKT
jgi:hypothetical protein